MSEFVFDQAPWEARLEDLQTGDTLSAVEFLALTRNEGEEEVEEALRCMEEKDILLDVSMLPKSYGAGNTAQRLRQEEQLVAAGKLPEGLEPTDPLRMYLEETAAIPVCGDLQVMAQQMLSGDRSVVERLTNGMLSLVLQRAYEQVGKGVLLLDLIQEGSLGLWQGILSYTDGDIEAYCDRHIRREIGRVVTMQARQNGVGEKMYQAMQDYRDVQEQLLSELGRSPTISELAERLHMTEEETAAVAKEMDNAQSLARAKQPEQEETESEEETQAVEDTAYFQIRQRVSELMSELEEQEAKILSLRFGLEDGKALSPEEIGKRLHMTPEEVAAKEGAALAKMRNKD